MYNYILYLYPDLLHDKSAESSPDTSNFVDADLLGVGEGDPHRGVAGEVQPMLQRRSALDQQTS